MHQDAATVEYTMNRRETIVMLAAGVAGASPVGSTAESRPGRTLWKPDPANPRDLAKIYRKLAWIDGEGFGIWWLKGRRYAAVPPTYIPFWDMLIGTLFTVRDLDSDTYAVTSLTTTFYTDIDSGALLATFHNPVTGHDVKVNYPPARPTEQRYGLQGPLDESLEIPGTAATRNHSLGPAFVQGDDIWLRSDFSARTVPTDPTRQAFQVEDLTTYFGSFKDMADPAAKSIPVGQVFTDLLNYPAWLEMGDRNGHYFSRCFGRKVFAIDAMPQDWQRLMSENHPDILKDPRAALHGSSMRATSAPC
jgi:hypothetical protein